MVQGRLTKQEIGWALYDWANSAFATVVIAGFFPIYFKRFLGAALTAPQSTFWLGVANSMGAVLLAISAPILGTISDYYGNAKRLLVIFMGIGIAATIALGSLSGGQWQWGGGVFMVSLYAFGAANLFYDALLGKITSFQRTHRISSLGYALGYIGGGILFLWCVLAVRNPAWINAPDEFAVMRNAFWWVGVWWALFSVPLIMWIRTGNRSGHQKPHGSTPTANGVWRAIARSIREIRTTFKEIKHQPGIALFLLAYWCYIDGVHTIIRMAVDIGTSLGFSSVVLVSALLMVQFVSFPATLLYYRLGKKIGGVGAIMVGIYGYIGISLIAILILSRPVHFFILAFLVALFQGGIQAFSRSVFSTIIPNGKEGEYFGFYNMLGKFAAILGPVLLGGVVLISNDYRLGITPVLLLLIAGLVLLRKAQRHLTTSHRQT